MNTIRITAIALLLSPSIGFAKQKLTSGISVDVNSDGLIQVHNGYSTNYIFRGIDPATGDRGEIELIAPSNKAVDFDIADLEWSGLFPSVDFKPPSKASVTTSIGLGNYNYPNNKSWKNSDFVLHGASLVDLVRRFPADKQEGIDVLTLFLLNTVTLADIGLEALERGEKSGLIAKEKIKKLTSLAELLRNYEEQLKRTEVLLSYSQVMLETVNAYINAANITPEDAPYIFEFKKYFEITLDAAAKVAELTSYTFPDNSKEKDQVRGTIKQQFKQLKSSLLKDIDFEQPARNVIDNVAEHFSNQYHSASNDSDKAQLVIRYMVEPLNATLKAHVQLLEMQRSNAAQKGHLAQAERFKNQIEAMRNGRALLTLTSLLFATPDFLTTITKEPEKIVPLLIDIGHEVAGILRQSVSLNNAEIVTKALWQKASNLDGRKSSFHKIRKAYKGAEKAQPYMAAVASGMTIGNRLIPYVWDLVLAPNRIQSSIVDGQLNSYGQMKTLAKVYRLDNFGTKEPIASLSNFGIQNASIGLLDGERIQIDLYLSRPKMFDETRAPWLINDAYVPSELYTADFSAETKYSYNFLCAKKVLGDLEYASYHWEDISFDLDALSGKCGNGTWFGGDWFENSARSTLYEHHSELPSRYKLFGELESNAPVASFEYTYQQGDTPVEVKVSGLAMNRIKHLITIKPKPQNIGFSYDELRTDDGNLNVLFDVSQIVGSEYDPVSHFIWNFGDGSSHMTSYNQAIAHTYNEDGTYTITLTVVTESGQQYQLEKVITLGIKPDAPYFVKIDSTINDDDSLNLELFWQEVEGVNDFNIYIANESFADLDDIANYASLSGARRISVTSNTPYTIDELLLDTDYFVVITSQNQVNESVPSNELKVNVRKPEPSSATGKLNDTGITWCADGSTNNLDCPISGYEGQDAEHGRDALAAKGQLQKVGGGKGGFDFTKLDANGNPLPESASQWSCVKDNHTGLIWEVKTDDGGLHDKDDRYNWYNPDSNTNGGHPGYQDDDGDICYGYDTNNEASYCNTHAYVERVNTQSLCGASDWRLPKKEELRSIVDYSTTNPAIDTDFFPQTRSSWYWSSSPYAYYDHYAWGVYFDDGSDYDSYKLNDGRVRLVRAGQ
ncbi:MULTISPECIES: Lcl domain-containing protein [unclassified Pseudoalteromonas]|uniref:Lcl domain-containing protein n=1 Tax=unclassified Pseudoalteromonas TaxID=194690 RepID=UPI0030148D58